MLGSDVVSLTDGTATFADKNVGNNKTVTLSGASLSGADAGNYTLASGPITDQADITARSLTVSAAGVNKVYDGTTNATVTLSDNRMSGDVLTTNYANASFADKIVGTGKAVSVNGITVTGTDAGNYTFNTTASTTANITKRSVTGSFTASDKVFDGNASATIATRSLNSFSGNVGKVAADVVTLTGGSATFDSASVGTGKTVTATGFTLSGADAGNYDLAAGPWTTTASILYAPATSTCLGSPGRTILQPINADGSSVFKQGSTVPAKFRVCDANGNSIGTPGVVTSFKLIKTVSGLDTITVDEAVVSTTPDTAFRWSATDQQWIFNINTKSLATNKTYTYRITLNDGTFIDFEFGLKK